MLPSRRQKTAAHPHGGTVRAVRILITGSRDWDDVELLEDRLRRYLPAGAVTLVSGACLTGADALAEAFADRVGWIVEKHPADWSRGRKAGPERNNHMVALGADVCEAFIGHCSSPRCAIPGQHPSHGASGCAQRAEDAGISTHRTHPTAR